MARYKDYDYSQGKFIPINFDKQILPGTFEYTLHCPPVFFVKTKKGDHAKWIKQHLRIKRFYGTSENAVKTQIWVAVSMYVLIAIIKKKLNLDTSLYTLLQILSVTLFEKMPLQQALQALGNRSNIIENQNQLNLFNS